VQFVRTTYDVAGKKARAVVVGRMPLENPGITDELCAVLTDAEVKEAEVWIEGQGRLAKLREELAAMTLAETLALANRWFARQTDSGAAARAAANLLPELQALRRTLKTKGLLE
jgi:hypothetical protein